MRSTTASISLLVGLAAVGAVLVITGSATRPKKGKRMGKVTTGGAVRSPEADLKAQEGAHRHGHPYGSEGDRSLMSYFLLTGVISVPFLLIGRNKLPLPVQLPASALMFVSPVLAASVLTYRRSGLEGFKAFLKKALDFGKVKNKIWFIPALLLMPTIFFLSYLVMRLTGQPLPKANIRLRMVPVFFALYLIAAMGEELGWMGYAIDPMQKRWGALGAAIRLGLIWSLWHVIPDIQNGRTPDWILCHRLFSVGLRVLIIWMYNNTEKSVFAAVLVHTMDNVSVSLFPNYGSHYNPFITGVIIWITTGIVIIGWGPQTLARYRFGRD